MTDRIIQTETLQGIADAIRAKKGTSEPIAVTAFASEIGNIESGGGLAINGIIEQYKVNAGATVNAGDFVEFVNKWGSGEFYEGTVSRLSACKLDNSRVFIAYKAYDGSNYRLCVRVCSIADASITFGSELAIYSDSNGGLFNAISAVALSDSKVFIAYKIVESSSYYTYATVCTITGITIASVGLRARISGKATNSYSFNAISAVALSDSKVFIAYKQDESSGHYLYGVDCTIDGTAITVGTTATISSRSGSGSYNQTFNAISAVALSDSKVFVAYKYMYDASNGRLYSRVCTINETAITVGIETTISNNGGLYNAVSAVALNDSKVFAAYPYYDGTNYYLYGVVCTIDGTTITKGTETTISSDSMGGAVSAVALNDSKVFAVHRYNDGTNYYLYGVVCTIDGTTITKGTETTMYSSISSSAFQYVHAMTFSETSVLVLAGGAESIYVGATVDGTTITVQEAPETDGTFVQPAHSRLHNVGVAATSGAEGETVDVYVVG